jgi:hypothetical protein
VEGLDLSNPDRKFGLGVKDPSYSSRVKRLVCHAFVAKHLCLQMPYGEWLRGEAKKFPAL